MPMKEEIKKKLQSRDEAERIAGLKELSDPKPPDVPLIRSALRGFSNELRLSALPVLARIPSAEAVELISQIFFFADPKETKDAALNALTENNSSDAEQVLLVIAQKQQLEWQNKAITALSQRSSVSDQTLTFLRLCARDASIYVLPPELSQTPELQVSAINALAKLKDATSISLLGDVAKKFQAQTFMAALQALQQIGGDNVPDHLLDLLAVYEGNTKLQEAILQTLATQRFTKQQEERLLPLLQARLLTVKGSPVPEYLLGLLQKLRTDSAGDMATELLSQWQAQYVGTSELMGVVGRLPQPKRLKAWIIALKSENGSSLAGLLTPKIIEEGKDYLQIIVDLVEATPQYAGAIILGVAEASSRIQLAPLLLRKVIGAGDENRPDYERLLERVYLGGEPSGKEEIMKKALIPAIRKEIGIRFSRMTQTAVSLMRHDVWTVDYLVSALKGPTNAKVRPVLWEALKDESLRRVVMPRAFEHSLESDLLRKRVAEPALREYEEESVLIMEELIPKKWSLWLFDNLAKRNRIHALRAIEGHVSKIDHEELAKAIEMIAGTGDRSLAQPFIQSQLDSTSEDVKVAALRALGHLYRDSPDGSDAIVGVIYAKRGTKAQRAREAVVIALGEISHHSVIDKLHEMARLYPELSSSVRTALDRVYQRYSSDLPPSKGELIERIGILGRLKHPKTIEQLGPLLHSNDDFEIRIEAAKAIAATGDPNAVQFLQEMEREEPHATVKEEIQKAIAVLVRSGDFELVQGLRTLAGKDAPAALDTDALFGPRANTIKLQVGQAVRFLGQEDWDHLVGHLDNIADEINKRIFELCGHAMGLSAEKIKDLVNIDYGNRLRLSELNTFDQPMTGQFAVLHGLRPITPVAHPEARRGKVLVQTRPLTPEEGGEAKTAFAKGLSRALQHLIECKKDST